MGDIYLAPGGDTWHRNQNQLGSQHVFGIVLVVTAIILAITTPNLARPSSSPIHHPQLLLLY